MTRSRCARQLHRTLRPSLLSSRSASRVQAHQWLYQPKKSSQRAYTTTVSAAELQFGQPLHETHPHLLAPGELTPGITALEYALRRSKLAAKLPENSIAILASSDMKYRSGSVFYDFHQDPNFFYLTGFNEPEAVAVIGKSPTAGDHTFHLFLRPKSPKDETWEGPRSGLQAALDVFNADETGDINHLYKHLRPLIGSASAIYTDIPTGSSTPHSILARLLAPPASPATESFAALLKGKPVHALRPLVHDLRAFKSPAEIANMRRAGQASGRALSDAMRRTWALERDLANFIDYRFRQLGCERAAYIPVVAGGRNARAIHYVRNDMAIAPGDWVLVDAGGEYGGYVTDITRTFPAGGKTFSGPQKELYQAVLTVQKMLVDLCRQDAGLSLDKLHDVAAEGLRDALLGLGFDLSGRSLDSLFPHHVGHYLGLDVHDCPGFSRNDPLQTGQVVTIEPGVYVPDDDKWPEAFRGLGVRIEDSVCVQEETPLVLTTEAVKEIVDIEALKESGL